MIKLEEGIKFYNVEDGMILRKKRSPFQFIELILGSFLIFLTIFLDSVNWGVYIISICFLIGILIYLNKSVEIIWNLKDRTIIKNTYFFKFYWTCDYNIRYQDDCEIVCEEKERSMIDFLVKDFDLKILNNEKDYYLFSIDCKTTADKLYKALNENANLIISYKPLNK